MKSYKAYSDSKYLRQVDFPKDTNLTLCAAREEVVQAPGKEPKTKVVLYFDEFEKGLPLNQTNGDVLAEITGSEDPENWIGTRVVGYVNPNVVHAGKKTGGIRLRAPDGAIPF
jgi:hypothetical protein